MVIAAGTAHAAGSLYAAIAVGSDQVGEATDYPTQIAADEAALRACDHGDPFLCRIKARVQNACASVVERDARKLLTTGPVYFVGAGVTAVAAEREAKLFESMSPPVTPVTKPAFVLDTICTSNAR
ncbi:DUF4189 domain-containing protein [Nocardia alni]|uniref:DUF4189 domain-containing protein n=1 Tax=Nocardia alni TaxID=2815723 RepID=UPI001C223C92|nr:DUF4189 domain-containing protein [Nocardia alni]